MRQSNTVGSPRLTELIIAAAMKVHSALGPGLLESAYQACLAFELRQRGMFVEEQVPLPIVYQSVQLDVGDRMDMVVERQVVLELKAVTKRLPVHDAQLLSNLKLSNLRVGLMINFHVIHLKDGITRMVN